MHSKNIHFSGAAVILLLCIAAVQWVPDLTKDATSTLGTVGFFFTAYGVLFAIVELHRAKVASLMAKDAAENVFKALTNLVTAREIIECQSTINVAVCVLEEGKNIPVSTLHQIIKLYSQVFHAELIDEKSLYRKNRSTVESYALTSAVGNSTISARNTARALLSISGQLAQLQGSTKNFTDYKQ